MVLLHAISRALLLVLYDVRKVLGALFGYVGLRTDKGFSPLSPPLSLTYAQDRPWHPEPWSYARLSHVPAGPPAPGVTSLLVT